MSEITVENQICNACGAEVRKGALFCYNCGGAVAPRITAPKAEKIDDENQVYVEENKVENGNKVNGTKPENNSKNEPESLRVTAEKPVLEPEVRPETNLKSAASLRKKPKIIQNKKIEIIWEEYNDAPNIRFVLAAVVLALFAGGIMWLAFYFG